MMGGVGKWIARALALAGLVVVGLIAYNLVSTSVDDIRSEDETTTGSAEDDGEAECVPRDEDAISDGFYIVREGDLISLIAQQTCVPTTEIARLNPDVDPQALTPGQCINLSERGCKNVE